MIGFDWSRTQMEPSGLENVGIFMSYESMNLK